MDQRSDACAFCDIISRTSEADVVFADEVAVAFLDRRPLFLGHTLVVPVQHVVELSQLPADQVGPFFARVQLLATVVPMSLDVPGTFVAMNNIVSQSVPHLHTHVVPRRKGDGLRGFFWPRHSYGDGESAEFAARLRTTLAAFDVQNFLADR